MPHAPPKQGISDRGVDDPSPSSLSTKTGHGKRGTLTFGKALERAFHQGRGYITALPADEGRQPFLIVCDVGHSFDLYAEFTCTVRLNPESGSAELAERLAASFGRKNNKRTDQITAILATLKALGHI